MSVNLSPIGNDAPFVDASGNPLNAGQLYTFTASSSTPENTYTTSLGNIANANPVVLDSNGYPSSGSSVVEIWLTAGVSYKFVLKTSAGVTVWTRDNISGINDQSNALDQWVVGPAPTFVSGTQFTLVGDQTSAAHVGRRVKVVDSGGTKYGYITASVFAVLTTVTVEIDAGGSLASPTTALSYGLLTSTNPSTPLLTDAYPIVSGSADKTKRVKLEVDGLTTATTRTLTVQDEDGTVSLTSEFDYSNVAGSLGRMPFPSFWVQGLISTIAADTAHDITISIGQARDATNAQNMILAAAITKQLDANWAVGNNAGGLDTGAAAINTKYYIWLIKRSDTGVVDVLFSTSATAPTMPGAGAYDFKRLIGFFMTDGSSQLRQFTTYEYDGGALELNWTTPPLDIDSANSLTTARRTDSLSVPAAFSVIANINVFIFDATTTTHVLICNPDETDAAPATAVSPLFSVHSTTAYEGNINMKVRTSSTGTIAARADLATVDTYRVVTLGFTWSRRN